MTIQMKTTEQYFPVMLFMILYKVVLTFESVDEFLRYDHSNIRIKQYFPVVLVIKGPVSWGFGIISQAQKWIDRNCNRKIMV